MQDQQPSAETCIDPMVGVSNRRYFDERYADLLSICQRVHSELSILIIDLDHFSQFNKRYGRSAGDSCLRVVGECVAKSFVRSTDCVARYGGEEFAVLSLASNIEDLRKHAHALCSRVRALNIPHSDSPHGVLTISIGGVHRLPNRGTTEEALIEIANWELLAAKHDGRDCVHIAG